MKKALLFVAAIVAVNLSTAQVELINNGGFEDGSLTPWTLDSAGSTDGGPGSCTENWRVASNSFDVCGFVDEIDPAAGSFAAYTSFDGNTANTEWIMEQMISIPATIVAADFSFDFAANFDFSLGSAITIPRQLFIDLYRMDGTPFSNFWNDDFIDPAALSVSYSETIDVSGLLSGIEGQDAIIRITAIIPEPTTGPSKAMIDNVSFIVDDGLSVDEFSLGTTLSISPNPTNGAFTLTNNGRDQIQGVTLYDITGKRLKDWNFNQAGKTHTLSADLPSGVYLLKVFTQSSAATKKLIIQ